MRLKFLSLFERGFHSLELIDLDSDEPSASGIHRGVIGRLVFTSNQWESFRALAKLDEPEAAAPELHRNDHYQRGRIMGIEEIKRAIEERAAAEPSGKKAAVLMEAADLVGEILDGYKAIERMVAR
jgi:hypothetical protein